MDGAHTDPSVDDIATILPTAVHMLATRLQAQQRHVLRVKEENSKMKQPGAVKEVPPRLNTNYKIACT
jgi:hypothetical protein